MNGVSENILMTNHIGQLGGRGLSPRLWRHVAGQAQSPDGCSNAVQLGDDFLSFGGAVTSNAGLHNSEAGSYVSYVDTNNSIEQADLDFGAMRIAGSSTNLESWIQGSGGTGRLGSITATQGSRKALVFETRFAFTPQVATLQGGFIGLGAPGSAVTNYAADTTTVLKDASRLGFRFSSAASSTDTVLSLVYRKVGSAQQTPIATLATVASGVYVKAGLVYDPKAAPSKRLQAYVDNVANAVAISETDIAASTFPGGVGLSFLAGFKSLATSLVDTLDVDWWNFYQHGSATG